MLEATSFTFSGSHKQVEQLSTHERRQERLEKRMKQLEKANLEQKDWTQQGEVTAKKRPKNSALEVELDFEHNIRPPPVITEEVTASLEDMIRARIAEASRNAKSRLQKPKFQSNSFQAVLECPLFALMHAHRALNMFLAQSAVDVVFIAVVIFQGRFDDVQHRAAAPAQSTKERVEIVCESGHYILVASGFASRMVCICG